MHPADLRQRGNLHRHLGNLEKSLKKNGLLRSPGGEQTESPLGDVLYSSTEDLWLFSALQRRQRTSLEFSSDGIAKFLSFCPRLHAVHTPQGFKAGGRYRVAVFQSCRIFARIPDRLEAPVLNITERKKAFAVFELMSIRLAIWLVVYPCIRRSRASFSRFVK